MKPSKRNREREQAKQAKTQKFVPKSKYAAKRERQVQQAKGQEQ